MASDRARDNLHGRVAALEDDVSAIRGDLAGLIVGQKGIADAVSQLAIRVNQPAPATNWIGIGTLVLASFSVLGALGVATLDPIRSEARQNTERLKDLSAAIGANARGLAENEATNKFTQEWTRSIQGATSRQNEDIAKIRERVASLEAKERQ